MNVLTVLDLCLTKKKSPTFQQKSEIDAAILSSFIIRERDRQQKTPSPSKEAKEQFLSFCLKLNENSKGSPISIGGAILLDL